MLVRPGSRARRTAVVAVATAVVGSLVAGTEVGLAASTPTPTAGATTQAVPPLDPPAEPPTGPGDLRPNVVVVLTDDQRRDTLPYMPRVQQLLVDKGVSYSNAMVPTSLCCPSRATILTGLYAHTLRTYGNGDVGGPARGGWPRFQKSGAEERTMAVALRDAGYRTGLVGKYLNFFGDYAGYDYTPPGWDVFSTFMSRHGRFYNYRLNDGMWHGRAPANYSTDVFAAKATDFIRSTPSDKPLFLFFAPYGPHAPYKPAERHLGTMEGLLADYEARTLRQKRRTMPRWMRERPSATRADVAETRVRQVESLLAVDEAVSAIHGALADTGRARNTLYLFLSDNGYFWGEHRIIGKDAPYQDATDIPMVARWDGHIPAGVTDDRIVLNVDVARTVMAATGAAMRTDGLDMFGPDRRGGFPLEAMEGYHDRPAYCGYRTKHRMYVRWATGEQELFDYRLDPHERRNLAAEPDWNDVRKQMRVKAKKTCSPEPPKYDWGRRRG